MRGKKIKWKNDEGMKVNRKWKESKMIFRLFGISEKVKGKKDVYVVNDKNILMIKWVDIFIIYLI